MVGMTSCADIVIETFEASFEAGLLIREEP
jgi:hypothetical protein